jgi:hypothetical protein
MSRVLRSNSASSSGSSGGDHSNHRIHPSGIKLIGMVSSIVGADPTNVKITNSPRPPHHKKSVNDRLRNFTNDELRQLKIEAEQGTSDDPRRTGDEIDANGIIVGGMNLKQQGSSAKIKKMVCEDGTTVIQKKKWQVFKTSKNIK